MDIPKIIINEYDMFCEENCDMEITLGDYKQYNKE